MTDQLPEAFWQAIEQFNQGEFYTCHDTLEAIWMEAPTFEKNFYQGILQVAVAIYHLGNRNLRGAVILLGEGLNRLRKYQPEYGGIEVDRFINDSTNLLTTLQQMGAEEVGNVMLCQSLGKASSSTTDQDGKIILQIPIVRKLTASVE
ncbi:DUF309 domain-containing protein [Phormidesmis priestleyi ULC007]|uniref:DUF309 domain-containing protein n=1 Tax=Phormidesmis priestleyi ULC007 TaxID=1920490 RepID=A0A2T1DFJ2_9CYAN|nr:DUF309 domain-containing protein [Phormidesmis priestleyi]PSB19262.1 DUF309 domain-containing protein [Phormidesmis priestleyi ULC007]PZO52147.1 MAG: DUF309 domain-containing protein [Phormidesmis priestleyi]